jgi:hypothetical protein
MYKKGNAPWNKGPHLSHDEMKAVMRMRGK